MKKIVFVLLLLLVCMSIFPKYVEYKQKIVISKIYYVKTLSMYVFDGYVVGNQGKGEKIFLPIRTAVNLKLKTRILLSLKHYNLYFFVAFDDITRQIYKIKVKINFSLKNNKIKKVETIEDLPFLLMFSVVKNRVEILN